MLNTLHQFPRINVSLLIDHPSVFIISLVSVDEWLQEVETLSVQDMPRSASSLSVRTDVSGTAVLVQFHLLPATNCLCYYLYLIQDTKITTWNFHSTIYLDPRRSTIKSILITQEHPSSDSFYDSDGDGGSDLTTVERPGSAKNAPQHEEETTDERQRHDSEEVDGE